MHRSQYTVFIVVALSFALGIFAHAFFFPRDIRSIYSDIREVGQSNSLTNPLLECAELPESISVGTRIGLQERIEAFIDDAVTKGTLSHASVYFRDLNNGPWFGIGEERDFYPASLLKLPLAMSLYQLAETDQTLMDTYITYDGSRVGDVEETQPYQPHARLEKDKEYSVEELVGLMLRESSNEAALILSQIIGLENIQKVYRDFGQEMPLSGQELPIDVHTYASFFRILYNATYLDRDDSEKILKFLTESTFKDGIIAGVSSDIQVAHKFGTRSLEGNERQLHDCGIVYADETPYILCIMSQGNDYAKLAGFIKEVSRLVYTEVAK